MNQKIFKNFIPVLFFLLFLSLSHSQNVIEHNTGSLRLSVFDNGLFGQHVQSWTGNGLHFESSTHNALFCGGIIVGNRAKGIVGNLGSNTIYDMRTINTFEGFTSNENFNQIATSDFSDILAPDPYGISIHQRTFSNTGDDYVFVQFSVNNTSENTIDSLYVGIFADWDVGGPGFDVNRGGYDKLRSLAYQYENGPAYDGNYYGVIALNGMSGSRVIEHDRSYAIRDSSIKWISSIFDESILVDGDYTTHIGTGPFNVQRGDSAVACFAFVAGSNLEDLQNNADEAQQKYNNIVAPQEYITINGQLIDDQTGDPIVGATCDLMRIEYGQTDTLRKIVYSSESDENGEIEFYVDLSYTKVQEPQPGVPETYVLGQNFPNPFNPSTTIPIYVSDIDETKIEIFDVLGRRVVEHNQILMPGYYDAVWESRHPAGIYFVRFHTKDQIQTIKIVKSDGGNTNFSSFDIRAGSAFGIQNMTTSGREDNTSNSNSFVMAKPNAIVKYQLHVTHADYRPYYSQLLQPADQDLQLNLSPYNTIKTIHYNPANTDSLEFPGQMKVIFPQGATDSSVDIRITSLGVENHPSLYANTVSSVPVYSFTPSDLEFNTPIIIELDTSVVEVPLGYSYHDVVFSGGDTAGFTISDSWYSDGKINAELNSFSMHTVDWRSNDVTKVFKEGMRVYQDNGYLCLDNLFTKILLYDIFILTLKAMDAPSTYPVIYDVRLYEDRGFLQKNPLILAKVDYKVVWKNDYGEFDFFWSPHSYNSIGEPIPVLDYPPLDRYYQAAFNYRQISQHVKPDMGIEGILVYGPDGVVTDAFTDIPPEENEQGDVIFRLDVFHNDLMREFIPLSALSAEKEYYIRVKIRYKRYWIVLLGNQYYEKEFRTNSFKIEEIEPLPTEPNTAPQIENITPTWGDVFQEGSSISFHIEIKDDEQSTFTSEQIEWSFHHQGTPIDPVYGNPPILPFELKPGSWYIQARVTDDGGLSSNAASTWIRIETPTQDYPPTADFNVTPKEALVSTVFNVDASASWDREDRRNQLHFQWEWGDGDITDGGNSYLNSHQYTSSGIKEIILKVRDTDGNESRFSQSVLVIPEQTPPYAYFEVDPEQGTISTEFQFDASGSDDAEDQSTQLQVRWDFENDGTWEKDWSTDKTESHQFGSPGTYTVKLELKDTGDLTDEATKQVIVSESDIETSTMTGNDGKTYITVKIGNQWWMAENLRETKYRDGSLIPDESDDSDWSGLSTGARCAYKNDESNVVTYGYLYNWYAVNDNRNIAPAGWCVPTDEELKDLEIHLGMSQSDADDIGWRGTDEGDKLKSTNGWNSGDNGTNESYFSALPGGYRTLHGSFCNIKFTADFWSATESTGNPWYRELKTKYSTVARYTGYKNTGLSVRLIRDLDVILDHIEIMPSTKTLSNGENWQFACAAYNTDGTDSDVTADVTWSVSPGIAGSINDSGLFVAHATNTGTETITATHKVETAQAIVTVIASSNETDTMIGNDGKTYNTVKIGDQWWMAENLRETEYRDGSQIDPVTDNSEWGNKSTGARCVYDNNESHADTYGYLYNWYAVDDSRNLAPVGWHVPTDEEWKELEIFLGMSQSEADKTGGRGTEEGGKLKEEGPMHWEDPNTGATNERGFSALPAGYRSYDGSYYNMGYVADFWSSTEYDGNDAWNRWLGYVTSGVTRYHENKLYGFSLRLVSENGDQSNTKPTASFTVEPDNGTTQTNFQFDASGSTDNEDDASDLRVRWDWENDGTWDKDWSTDQTESHQFESPGTYTVKLEVKDTGDLKDDAIKEVTVSAPEIETGTMTGNDGQIYNTIKIGDQWWTAENLRETEYRDGSVIPNVSNDSEWSGLSNGARCAYDDDESNVETYGYLYNGYAVLYSGPNAIDDSRNIAPEGWHVPSDEEWKILERFLGVNQNAVDQTGWRGTDEGNKLKETGTSHWNGANTGATNEKGFSAVPGGACFSNGSFDKIGDYAYFWTSTVRSNNHIWLRYLGFSKSSIGRGDNLKKVGFSVRLVKD